MMKTCLFAVWLTIGAVFTAIPLTANDKNETITIGEWLSAGSFPVFKPAYHDRANRKNETFTAKQLLESDWNDISRIQPSEGTTFLWRDQSLKWNKMSADSSGFMLSDESSEIYAGSYAAVYIEVKRWMKIKLILSGHHLFQAFIDGKLITAKSSADDTSRKEQGKAEAEVKLETGKHLLIVKNLRDPGCDREWKLKGEIILSKNYSGDLKCSSDPAQSVTIGRILEAPRITQTLITPDGEWAAVSLAKSRGDQTETWAEIRQLSDGKLIHSTRGLTGMSQVQWAPSGRRLSYTSYSNKETTLWIMDYETGTLMPVMDKQKNFSRYIWSPDGKNIFYELNEKSETEKTGLKKIDGLKGRQPGSADRTHLYRLHIESGFTERLTAGPLSTYLYSVSPDGNDLLMIRQEENLSKRPYTDTYISVLNLGTMAVDSLWTMGWFSQAEWSPDGSQLLVIGGPSLFNHAGVNLPDKKMIPNDYDNQAYIYDRKTKEVRCISLNFNPSIDKAVWNAADGNIYFETTDRSFSNLYRYRPDNGKYELIETGIDAVSGFDLASKALKGVFYGSGAANPQKAYRIDLSENRSEIFYDPVKEDFRNVLFGRVERWTFKNKNKTEIDGYVHYPPDFDPAKSYPCIVYYYGGTTPVTRDFGGRYPKELYAANGYIVYTLQPGGAIGYGQFFSAAHVNNWGITVADEIIDGVKKFLDAHPFVDKKRVGCIGASYGGFMTMLLMTKTEMFATAISHAGISSISSYWGEGYWGYAYSAMATANSFPWNRKDIYVNQSPLYSADKIKTPLLLLHGSSDTNVPVGESIQLYTALKLLNRPVELIQLDDQDHLIMQYSKRLLWTKTILAWFDHRLKDQPEWWNDMYPEK